jgi:hypothetical protein
VVRQWAHGHKCALTAPGGAGPGPGPCGPPPSEALPRRRPAAADAAGRLADPSSVQRRGAARAGKARAAHRRKGCVYRQPPDARWPGPARPGPVPPSAWQSQGRGVREEGGVGSVHWCA